MIILHVVEALGGGIHTYFKELTSFFSQKEIAKDYKIYIIYCDKRKEITSEVIQKDFGDKVTLIKVNMESHIKPFKDLNSAIKISKIIKNVNPDIIHLHSSKASIIGRFASFISLKKHKLFYTPHGYSFLRQDISKTKQLLFKNIEKYTQLLFGGTTIACGDTEYEIAKKIGKSELVRNGININEITKYYKNNSINNKLTFGIIGRISSQKNPKLFNEIALKFPNFNFIWIGDGDLRKILTSKNIIITGWLHNSIEVYEHLNKIDIFLQTSLWEGLPIALLEALAFKKPIIATNVIGNKDIVKDCYNGFLFDNINDLNDIFVQINDPLLIESLAINALQTCKDKFDINNNLNHLIKIYNK